MNKEIQSISDQSGILKILGICFERIVYFIVDTIPTCC